jgi:hypothetical protein
MPCPRLTPVLLVVIAFATPLFAQLNPVPFVNQPLAPSAVPPGSAGPTLTVNGAGFVPTSVVNWNGTALATTFVNHDKLTAVVPASDVASEGTAEVTVTSPTPGGGTSNAVPFTVTSRMAPLTFAPTSYSVGNSVVSVVAADFNHDGKPDLAIVNQSGTAQQCSPGETSGSVSVLLGNGDGTFTTKWTEDLTCLLPPFGASGLSVIAGDFNGDGKLDLGVLFNGLNHIQVAIFLGKGDGTFTYSQSLGGDDGAGAMVVGDFNRDGKLDLAYPFNSLGYSDIYIWYGSSNGTFNFTFGVDDVYVAHSLVAGDFNRDGILDLAAGQGDLEGTGQPPFSPILLGNGDGGFGAFTPAPLQPTASIGSSALTTGDFNGDGTLDLAFADYFTSALTVLLGNGDGTFRERRGQPVVQGFSWITIADMNGDSKLDLVIGNENNHTVSVLPGNGHGKFHAPVVNSVSGGPFSIAVADFDGDGKLDLVTANGDSTITVFLNTSARRSATTTSLVSSAAPSNYGQRVTWTATVTSSGPVTPTGRVRFTSGSDAIGEATLDSSGVATLTRSTLNAATYPLTAIYVGDAANLESTSTVLNQVVGKTATTAAISSSRNPSTKGELVTFTATITSPTRIPTGQVTFRAGTTVLGTVQLSGGRADLQISSLSAGSTEITVNYAGDSNFVGSSASLTQKVQK